MAMATALAGALALPAVAGAVTVTVTGDDGNPVALNPAAPTSLRQMNADIAVALTGTEKAYSFSVAGPVAPAASPRTCGLSSGSHSLDYQGNATYTVNVTTYTDTACKVGAAASTYQIAVGAGSPLTAPAGVLLTRKPNDAYTPITHLIPIALNPGALTHEIRIAKGGVIGPDGGISGASETEYADAQTGAVALTLDEPGRYVMVARPQGFTGAAGQFYAPWSPAISFRAIAPFDLTPLQFPDSRGPSYKIRGELREKTARGTVKIRLAKGKRGKFFSIGKAKVRGGVFKKRVTLHRIGSYRVRIKYSGSATTAPGTAQTTIRIERRFF
jgi:uncharacterized membrane protein